MFFDAKNLTSAIAYGKTHPIQTIATRNVSKSQIDLVGYILYDITANVGENMIVGLLITLMLSGGVFFGGIYYSSCERDDISHQLPFLKSLT